MPERSVHLERDLADWVTPTIHLVGLLETPEGPTQVIGYQTASALANARGATETFPEAARCHMRTGTLADMGVAAGVARCHVCTDTLAGMGVAAGACHQMECCNIHSGPHYTQSEQTLYTGRSVRTEPPNWDWQWVTKV